MKVGLKLRQGGAKTACRWGWDGDFCTESTVRRGVRDLEKAGFLSVEERFRWNKADSSNLYVLVGQSSEKQLLSK